MNIELKVGQIVTREQMRSGASAYGAGIVACVEPLLVTSGESDMCWSTWKPEDVRAIGMATAEAINASQRRVPAEHQVRKPCGESLLGLQLGCGLTLVELGLRPLAVDLNDKTKLWPSYGGWSAAIATEDNSSYGWLFEYSAEENLWRALRQCDNAERNLYIYQAQDGVIAVTRPGLGDDIRKTLVEITQLPGMSVIHQAG